MALHLTPESRVACLCIFLRQLPETWLINSLWRIWHSSSDLIDLVNQGQESSSKMFTCM